MDYNKLSAGMSALIEECNSPGASMLLESTRAVPLASFDAAGAPEVHAFIRCASSASITDTEGVTLHTQRGKVRTAKISLKGIDKLSERKDVFRIAPAVMLKPLNDVCAQRTRLPVFKGNHPERGKDVVIGIIDSGIDAAHPAFANRVDSIWDQTIPGAGWDTTNYGTVLRGPTLSVSADMHGHGTHVAGIAAGSDGAFGGVAPEARIICVKTNFLHTGIGDGIRYIFNEADKLGLPAVVNLSLGGHHDAHDGTDDLSELIDDESGPGRVIVTAAGNEGGDNIHAAADVPAGQTKEILFTVPPATAQDSTPWVRLNGWYSGGSCEISIRSSSGDATPFQAVIQGPNPSTTHGLGSTMARITTPPASVNTNNDHSFLVELVPGAFANRVQGGTWRLRIRNVAAADVRVDVWSIVPLGARDASFVAPFNNAEMKIGSPGAARQAITVASFTSRNKWFDSSGNSRAVGLPLNTISDFSSPGPLRNGSQKPDVTAPGAMIVSCLSSSSAVDSRTRINSGFLVMSGTSMACPYITGLVALLLEGTPTLDSAAVKALLKANSTVPALNPGTFHPSWGFGLIDAGLL